MKKLSFYITILSTLIYWESYANVYKLSLKKYQTLSDTTNKAVDKVKIPYKFPDESWDPTDHGPIGGLRLNNPNNIVDSLYYDPTENIFNFKQKMGKLDYRRPSYMTFDEYKDYDLEKILKKYWRQRHEAENIENKPKSLIPKLNVGGEAFDRIFGGNTVDIRPQGAAELSFGLNTNKTNNPSIATRNRKVTTFDFNQKIQINVVGKIGDKMKVQTNYDTEASFDFQNQVKLDYQGHDDEILKKIEAGNVTLPLNGSLISGSQALFGLKTEMQFGKTTVTTVLSQQKGRKQEVNLQGGAQTQRFEVMGDNYEANKHFFLSQFFRDRYDYALSGLPFINSPVVITKLEVYVTNLSGVVDNVRNIVALADLGESDRRNQGNIRRSYRNENLTWQNQTFIGTPISVPDHPVSDIFPDNYGSNNLYYKLLNQGSPYATGIRNINTAASIMQSTGMSLVSDYEVLERSKKLNPSEFTFNANLGYVSLNSPLNNNEVLAVAFQYTINGKAYQVGEFSTDGIQDPQCLVLKMLKATNPRVRLPFWDLMMKNVYALGGYGITDKDFRLDILYNNREKGVFLNYVPDGKIAKVPLLQVLNLDSVNNQQQRLPDGVFDLIEGVTINKSNGRIYFPLVEPFGRDFEDRFGTYFPSAGVFEVDPAQREVGLKYSFRELYDSTKTAAQQIPGKNRFKIKGTYSSASGAEISLNGTNIPQNSVTVTANGTKLTENVDYTVDYAAGKVKIINTALMASNAAIKASYESQQVFNPIQRSLIGTNVVYKAHKDLTLGGTILRLTERPLTPKTVLGDEPIANTIVGIDGNYKTDAPWLTKLVDKIPLINTKEMSTLTMSGEAAYFIPGHSRAIGKSGTSYLDDFEATQSTIDLRQQFNWAIASLPQGQPDLFPEVNFQGKLPWNYNRAKLAWFTIDPLFHQNLATSPPGIKDNKEYLSNHQWRQVLEQEVFPNRQLTAVQQSQISMLDMTYYPKERGPYNYVVGDDPKFYFGLNTDGSLKRPDTRWAGLMRRIEQSDFETSNIEFIQLWLMDPYNEDNPNPNNNKGKIYFNIGEVSEDVLPDNRKSFEQGLKTSATDNTHQIISTNWGRIPVTPSIINAFDNDPSSRIYQDVGYDGLVDTAESNYFNGPFISQLQTAGLTPEAISKIQQDPSADNYTHFRSQALDDKKAGIIERYKDFSGLEKNSTNDPNVNYPTQNTTLPNNEDLNKDNNLNYNEAYFQYSIDISPEALAVVGQNNITNIVEANATTPNGKTRPIKWYQFKIPLRTPERTINGIQDLRSIRFFRMFLKDFKDTTILRFARLELVRGDWRKYLGDLSKPGEYIANDNGSNSSTFDLAAVNVEENGNRKPINYVLPPGIERVIDPTNSTNIRQQNEQSLSLKVCNLADGKSNAAYRNLDLDIRLYKRINMFVHAEKAGADSLPNALNDGDAKFFIRLGNDFDQNYYEYEYPLKFSNYGVTARDDVWPTINDLDLELDKLYKAKGRRNSSGAPLQMPYFEADPDDPSRIITIVGNPNLASVRTIMVGVRNPKRQSLQDVIDDGKSICLEIWVNELRTSDFNQQGGYAANGRIQAKLADLADLTVTASYKSQGFGGIEQKLQERSRDNTFLYDISSNIRLNKFLPVAANIQLPMYVDFSEGRSLPQFDPLNPDLVLRDRLRDDNISREERLRIRTAAEDYTRRKSINFTNVKKDKGKNSKKAHFYDIENLTASYSYNEVFRRNINIDSSLQRNHKAGLAYNFAKSPKGIKPFDKISAFNKIKVIKEFNFNFVPSRYSFRTDFDRQFNLFKPRNVDLENPDAFQFKAFYDKKFTTSRIYDFKYDPAKSINFDYTATNLSRIDEPQGIIDDSPARINDINGVGPTKRDSVKQNIRNFGRTTSFTQTANLNWTVPINKIAIFSWITSTASYRGKYDWIAAPPQITFDLNPSGAVDITKPVIANTISNSNQKQVNLNANFVTLYNKVPYLKNINNPKPKKAPDKKPKITKPDVSSKLDSLKKNVPLTKEEKAAKAAKEKAAKDSAKGPNIFLQEVARVLMMLKSASVAYTEGEGTSLPGYMKNTSVLGLSDANFNNASAPGLPFVFGSQQDILKKAADNNWITKSSGFNQPLAQTYTSTFTGTVKIEPVKDFKIDLNWNRTENRNRQGIYKLDTTNSFNNYREINSNETGNYSISTITWRTAFVKDVDTTYNNKVFEAFIANRKEASERIAKEAESKLNGGYIAVKEDGSDYYKGYGETQQDVLIPAFFAAYTGQSLSKVPLNFFKQLPKPNWRVAYDGLSKIAAIKKYFKTFTLNHSYRSTFNIANYTTNQFFVDNSNGAGFSNTRDIKNNFRPKNEIQVVTISESMSPFIGIDGTLQNSLQIKVQLNRERNISLSMANAQITEIKSQEIVTGVGYKFKDVKPPLSTRYGWNIKSDLNLRCDVSVRKNYTLIRRLASEPDPINPQLEIPPTNTRTAGQNTVSVRFSADYTINQKLNIRFFFDKVVNQPLVSASFRTSNANSGIALRFTIAQ